MKCMLWDRQTGKRCQSDFEIELCRFCGLQFCSMHRKKLTVVFPEGPELKQDPYVHVCAGCFARWFERYF